MANVVVASGDRWLFRCPGCGCAHYFNSGWSFNGDTVRATVRPSLLVSYNGTDAGRDGAPHARCHSFVTDGRIEFLGDSTHALAGKTVPLSPWDEDAPAQEATRG